MPCPFDRHFKVTEDANSKLACFCTAPNIRNLPQAFFCEVVGTFLLVLPVFLMTEATFKMPGTGGALSELPVGLGTLGALPVGLLVFAIGLSLGGTTGYAINPARDLGLVWRTPSCQYLAGEIAIGAMPGCRFLLLWPAAVGSPGILVLEMS